MMETFARSQLIPREFRLNVPEYPFRSRRWKLRLLCRTQH